MGMYDSFHTSIDGHDVEVQTKRFDKVLGRYRPGDVVSGAPAGVRVYFDNLKLDEDNRMIHGEDTGRHFTVFIVLVHGVFTEYQAVEGEEPDIVRRIEELIQQWSDTARIITRWLEFLEVRQNENRRLRAGVERILTVIDRIRRRDSGEEPPGHRSFMREEEERLERGDDVLDVLQSVLEGEFVASTSAAGTKPDPLDEHRL